jgi:hypothetical protein
MGFTLPEDWLVGWMRERRKWHASGKHSEEATSACGLQRLQGLLVHFCCCGGSPVTLCCTVQYRHCSLVLDACALILSWFYFALVNGRRSFIRSVVIMLCLHSSVSGHSKCRTATWYLYCKIVLVHFTFWFLTTTNSLHIRMCWSINGLSSL